GFFNLILAIFNLVPLLPFDGGHVAIACYEKVASRVTGRRVQADLRKLVPITAALVVFIVLVFLSSAYLDIRNLFG
ncbi:MAG: site-2 protease family protein, partial [Acidimicrobiia bacterium]